MNIPLNRKTKKETTRQAVTFFFHIYILCWKMKTKTGVSWKKKAGDDLSLFLRAFKERDSTA